MSLDSCAILEIDVPVVCRSIDEHVVHVACATRVPIAKPLVEGMGPRECPFHLGNLCCVPRRDVRIEIRSADKHPIHIGHLGCVPCRQVIVEGLCPTEHALHTSHS